MHADLRSCDTDHMTDQPSSYAAPKRPGVVSSRVLSVPVKRELLVLSTFREGLVLWVSTNLPAIAHTWKSSRSILSSLVDRMLFLTESHVLRSVSAANASISSGVGQTHSLKKPPTRGACSPALPSSPRLLDCSWIAPVCAHCRRPKPRGRDRQPPHSPTERRALLTHRPSIGRAPEVSRAPAETDKPTLADDEQHRAGLLATP